MSNKNVLISIPEESFTKLTQLASDLRERAAPTSAVEKNQRVKKVFIESGCEGLGKSESELTMNAFMARMSPSALASRLMVVGLEVVLKEPNKL